MNKHLPPFITNRLIIISFFLFLLLPALFAGGKPTEWEPVQGRDNWQHEIDLIELDPGVYNVILRGTDLAGNQFIEGPFNLRVDPNSDYATGRTIYPAEGEIVRGNINIVGVAVDDDGVDYVEIQLNDEPFRRAEGSEYWRIFVDASQVPDGIHTITVRPVDINGLEGFTTSSTFILDTQAPTITITSHESGDIVNGTITFQGEAIDQNGITSVELRIPEHQRQSRRGIEDVPEQTINIRPKIDRKTGNATFDYRTNTRELLDGPHIYWFTATDRTGTTQEMAFLFFVDNIAPEITIIDPPAESPTYGRVTITGSIRDEVGVELFTYTFDGQTTEIPLTPGNPFWTIQLETQGFTGRNIDVTFQAVDTSGNSSSHRHRLSNDRDGARPLVTIHKPVSPEDPRQPRRVSPTDFLTGTITGVNPPARIRVTGLSPEDPRLEQEFPAVTGFSLPLDQLPAGRRQVTLVGIDQLGYLSQPIRIDLLVTVPPALVSLENLGYDSGDNQPWYNTMTYDRLQRATLRGFIQTTAGIQSAFAVIGADATRITVDGIPEDIRPIRLSPRADATRGGYTFEIPLEQNLGFGPQPISVMVVDEFNSVSLRDFMLTYRDLRRLEVSPGILVTDTRMENNTLIFGTSTPALGRVLTRQAGVSSESLREISLLYPDPPSNSDTLDPLLTNETGAGDSVPSTELSPAEASDPNTQQSQSRVQSADPRSIVSLQSQGTGFRLIPGQPGKVDGLVIQAITTQGIVIRSQPITVIVDTQPPEIQLTDHRDLGIQLPVGQTTLTFNGEITDDQGVARAEISIDGGTSFQEIILSGTPVSRRFNHTLDFGERLQASYGIVIRAEDNAGNRSIVTRVVNTRTPEPLPVAGEDQTRRNDTPRVEVLVPGRSGVIQEGGEISGYIIDLDGTASLEIASADGTFRRVLTFDSRNHYQSFSISVPDLSPGRHTIGLRAIDRFSPEQATGPVSNTTITLVSGPGEILLENTVQGFSVPLGQTFPITGSVTQAERLQTLTYVIDDSQPRSVQARPNADNPEQRDFSFNLPANLEYRPEPYRLTISAGDSDGWLGTKTIDFFVQHPEPVSEPENRLVFRDSRWWGDTGIFSDLEPMFAYFDGSPVAKVELEGRGIGKSQDLPIESLIEVRVKNSSLEISPKQSGEVDDLYFLITDVDGLEFRLGPYRFVSDLTSPQLDILSPLPGEYYNQSPFVLFKAHDDVSSMEGGLTFEYRWLNQESWQSFQPRTPGLSDLGLSDLPLEIEPPTSNEPILPDDPDALQGPRGNRGRPPEFDTQSDPLGLRELLQDPEVLLAEIAQPPESGNFQHLEIRLTDQAGNQTRKWVSFVVDTQSPRVTFITPLKDTSMNGRTLVSGTIQSISPITLVRHTNDSVHFQDLVPGVGFAIEVDFSELENSDSQWYLQIQDAAGNSTTISPEVLVDLEADLPVVTIQIPEENAVITEDIVVSGMAFDDDGIAGLYWRLNEEEWQQLPGSNSFAVDISLSQLKDNQNTIDFYAQDLFGLDGPVSSRTFNVSLQEPIIELISPRVEETNRGKIRLEGTTYDENGVEDVLISLDNGTSFYRVEGSSEWYYDLDSTIFTDGTYSVQILAFDSFGVVGQYFTLVNIDNTPPEITLGLPRESSEVSGEISITGRVTDNTSLTTLEAILEPINDSGEPIVYRFPTNTIVQQALDLSEFETGWYNLRIIATDPAGNTTAVERNFFVKDDFQAHTVSLLFPIQGEEVSGVAVVEGRVRSTVRVPTVQLFLDDRLVGTAEVNSQGYFRRVLEDSWLSQGQNSIHVVIEPQSGERSESDVRTFVYNTSGPFITIDSHQIGDFIADRPWIGGTLGYAHSLAVDDPENRAELRSLEPESLQISLDNGRSFEILKPESPWRYRIETDDLVPGPLAIILQARFKTGETATIRSLYTVDKSPPQITLFSPTEGSRLNTRALFQGIASDDYGLESLEISLRPGDKSGYAVPGFIQGMYLDASFLGLTYSKVGLGFTFFDDNVKLQGNYGFGPQNTTSGEPARLSGHFIGGKLLANIFTLPFNALFGPDWAWLSLNMAVGADFSYILLYDPIERTNPITGEVDEVIRGVVLSAILAQLEFPRIRFSGLTALHTYSFYTQPEVWFVPSDVEPIIAFKLTFGIRVGLF